MTESNHCEHCGGPIVDAGVLGNACPVCLMERGLDSTSGFGHLAGTLDSAEPDSSAGSQPALIGRYKILRLIGEGGMGAVYEAEQEYPRRMVALKILKPGVTNSRTLRRFEQEAQALGRLQHPGIAQIYEAGTADTGFGPQPYFAMELIRGQSPRDYVKQHGLGIRDRLELVAKMAEAMHHAHQRGLIHRDLKPNNILVDETGQPKVLDFGVARAIGTDSQVTQQTDEGQLVGTLAYMSPEQVLADPQEIDTRTDVYALGIILYELLAGHLPYNTKGKLHETLTAIREEDPPPLGTLDRSYRGDIETIAAKALEKDKARRYTSAAELAADIRRYLADEPIAARPPTASYQLRKFARRNRALVLGAVAVFVALVAGVVVSSVLAVRAGRAEQAAVQESHRAHDAEARATNERNIALEAQQQAKASESAAIAARDRAEAAEETARHEATVARTQRLIATWQSLVQESLDEAARRSEYDRPALLAVQAMRFNARIPNQPRQGVEAALQQSILPTLNRDQSRVQPTVAALQQSIAEGLPHRMLIDNGAAFRAIAFSPDGVWVAAGGVDERLRLWDTRIPGAPPLVFPAAGRKTTGISAVAFSLDGTRVAAGSVVFDDTNQDTIRIWDLQNPSAPPLVLEGGGSIESLKFSPDGVQLASAAQIYQQPIPATRDPVGVVLWDLRNPKASRVLSRKAWAGWGQRSLGVVAFSPDGSQLAAASGETVELWNTHSPNGEPLSLRPPRASPPPPIVSPYQRTVYSVAFSPDGLNLAVSSESGVHVWDLRNLQRVSVPLPIATVRYLFGTLTYASDGSRLAATDGFRLWIWEMRNSGVQPPIPVPFPDGINAVAYSPKGMRLAEATPIGVRVRDFERTAGQLLVSTGPKALSFDDVNPVRLDAFVYSADLSRLVDALSERVRLWDLQKPDAPATVLVDWPYTARQILNSGVLTSQVGLLTVCRDGTRVVASSSVSENIRLSIWDVPRDGAKSQLFLGLNIPDSGRHNRVACSPDGTRVAVSGTTVHIVDLQKPDAPPLALDAPRINEASALAFSSDGNRLAVGSNEQIVQLWDLRNPRAQPLTMRMPANNSASSLAFSSDGSRLAAGGIGASNTALWDLENPGAPAQQFLAAEALALSPDGKRLATATNGSVRILDLQSPATPALVLAPSVSGVITLAFSSDGLSLKAGMIRGNVMVWRLWSAAADYLCSRVWRNLSMQEWQHYVGEGIPYERTCPALPPGI
jgi:WD40 repeat protein